MNIVEKKRHDLIEKRQEKHQINLCHFQNEVNQLMKEPNLTENQYSLIQHDIQLEEIKLNEFEHFRLTVSPLIINENLVVQ
ncbi:unnamed protein product [Rotaria sp. Silwood2]|nr:unnamed protein product [Rotaria sp. Silwood2]CAF4545175.1 unnamed protein product [Rotaria sp. Silwood2]